MGRKYSVALLIGWCISASLQAQVLPADSLALVELFNQTSGSSWKTKTNWLVPGQAVSTWYGVARTGNRVTSVILTDNNLTGSLPSSVGNLTGLVQLALGKNKLSGSIPSEIGNLVNCKFLFLGDNELTGSIPATVGNLVNLETLQLQHNKLSGNIPSSIGNLTLLKNLQLRNNQLTGAIPTTIGSLVNLQVLQLDSCQLSGSIPPELGNLTKLRDLYLEKNQLTGSIPPAIGNLLLLQRLVLNHNQLSGSIPDEVTGLTSLTYLNLQDNALTGGIPGQIGNLNKLTDLYLGNDGTGDNKNKLTGTIPPSIGELASLMHFKIKDDSLHGAVPDEFAGISTLKTLDLNNNAFTYLPEFLASSSSITSFDIRNNYFTFEDIYKNRNISGLLFEPQKATQVQDSATTKAAVGTVYAISIDDKTDGNSYAWTFTSPFTGKDSVISINSHTLLINPVNKNSMGTYSCVITNPTLSPTFVLYYKHVVNATSSMSGKIYRALGQPAQTGKVRIYELASGDFKNEYPDATVSTTGDYTFNDVLLSDYLVRAEVTDPITRVVTWYTKDIAEQSIYWEEADTVFFREARTDIDILAQIKPEEPVGGIGIITGTFYEVIPDGEGRISGRRRVAKAPVTVRMVEDTGRGKEELLTLIDYTLTDDNGEFTFDNLAEAEYKLNIQFPPFPMDEDSYIRITIGNSLFDRQVAVEAEVINDKIFVSKLIVTGWEREQHVMHAWPNPALHYLYVSSVQSEPVSFQLTDASGRNIQVDAHWNDDQQRWEVDVRDLHPGVYMLQVMQNGKTEKLRILIQ